MKSATNVVVVTKKAKVVYINPLKDENGVIDSTAQVNLPTLSRAKDIQSRAS